MTFNNQASERICHAIKAITSNIADLRALELDEVANSMNSEIEGLLLALAICEGTGTIAAKEMFYKWVIEG